MSHEELLAKIAQSGLEPYGNVMPTYLVLALCAVVELHKPADTRGWLVCAECPIQNYPCPTIQAIEKELA